MKCYLWGSRLEIYGLTQNTETKEYLMAFQYADNGNLHKFLQKNFKDLTWKTKLKLLIDILWDLHKIHDAGYILSDFHSGNVLILQNQSYVSDLGLAKKSYNVELGSFKQTDDNDSGGIYGVLPYVAPEFLSGQEFTSAVDIYSFGVIMSEMSAGRRPFDGNQFDDELAVKICFGLRPEFAPGTPDCYIELAKQCMNSDPLKRPNCWNVYFKLERWYKSMESSDEADEIKKQFLAADMLIKELTIFSPKHPDFMYTSKIINARRISAMKTNYSNYTMLQNYQVNPSISLKFLLKTQSGFLEKIY
ncbi:kinase-like domain-containing protein [Gigaspora rosea]|uniref:Kinase-like domain-containing protein n=1 Tax=Gigaspora rosea TaxID=44941 RepID=A0A397UA26_9GLOM|nr:kinase-like domain-containing protein [Gigaspora rosea]